MDFILPSDDTMELMREEFSKLKKDSYARAFALANNADLDTDSEAITTPENPPDGARENGSGGAYIGQSIATVLLLLYFVKHLGYNISYGTQIFNTHRGMEQLRSAESNFGQLNNLD